jgi:signal transduction protein with GAF and PtsI domain
MMNTIKPFSIGSSRQTVRLVFSGVIALLMLLIGFSVQAETKVSASEVKKETVEAVEAAGAYADERKEEFTKRMRANIDELDREMNDLKKETETASKEAKATANKRILEIQKKRDAMLEKYEALEKSSDKAWKKMKTGLEKAWGEVKSAYSEAKTELKSEMKSSK